MFVSGRDYRENALSILFNKRVWVEAYRAVRPVGVTVLAIAVLAAVMAGHGWEHLSAVLSGVMLLLVGIVVAQVYRSVRHLQRTSRDTAAAAMVAEQHYISVLQRIMKVTESKDKYARGRSERIGKLSEGVARQMGLDEEMCRQMNLAGQLHDIGLLAVSDAILTKPASLLTREMRTLQKHSEISYELLRPLGSLRAVLPAIRSHHERMNGTGYPQGLSGEQLPVEARILAVVDSYDAMTHDRPTRSAMSPMDAMRELQRCTPAGYDARCVEALATVINLPQLEQMLGDKLIVEDAHGELELVAH